MTVSEFENPASDQVPFEGESTKDAGQTEAAGLSLQTSTELKHLRWMMIAAGHRGPLAWRVFATALCLLFVFFVIVIGPKTLTGRGWDEAIPDDFSIHVAVILFPAYMLLMNLLGGYNLFGPLVPSLAQGGELDRRLARNNAEMTARISRLSRKVLGAYTCFMALMWFVGAMRFLSVLDELGIGFAIIILILFYVIYPIGFAGIFSTPLYTWAAFSSVTTEFDFVTSSIVGSADHQRGPAAIARLNKLCNDFSANAVPITITCLVLPLATAGAMMMSLSAGVFASERAHVFTGVLAFALTGSGFVPLVSSVSINRTSPFECANLTASFECAETNVTGVR
eukprot:COSAG02_NODE_9163_length_2305_cov_1.996374_2_plen_339_part_00